MDLVEREPREQRSSLCGLLFELLERVLLDLVRLAIADLHAPARGVLVAPFGTERE